MNPKELGHRVTGLSIVFSYVTKAARVQNPSMSVATLKTLHYAIHCWKFWGLGRSFMNYEVKGLPHGHVDPEILGRECPAAERGPHSEVSLLRMATLLCSPAR